MTRAESEIRLAQAAVERARLLLLFPSVDNLDSSRPLLEQACDRLRQAQNWLSEPGARKQDLAAGLGALRLTVRRAATLVEGAARYRAGWFRVLSAATSASYTREGGQAPYALPQSLSVEG
jgi:hypothetical protein